MMRPDHLHVIAQEQLSCEQLRRLPSSVVLVWSFHDAIPAPQLEACKSWLPTQLYSSAQGLPVFHAAPINRDLTTSVSAATPELPQPSSNEQLASLRTQIDQQWVEVFYSPLDMGQISDLFDNNIQSLIRGKDANPLVLELHFEQPRIVKVLSLTLATMQHASITVELTREDGEVTRFDRVYRELSGMPEVELSIPDGPQKLRGLRLEIHDLTPRSNNDVPHIHVRELHLR